MNKKKSTHIQDAIINMLKQTPGVPVNRKIISHTLGIRKSEYHIFIESLIDLVKTRRLIHVKKMQYAYPQKAQKLIGELRVVRAGYGFVSVENQDVDIFIAQPNLNTAFDRDIVEVQLYAASRGKRAEGFVKRVVERFRKQIVGSYHKTEYYSFVTPDDPKIYRDIIVNKEKTLSARNGQKVLVSFDRWERDQHNPEGVILEVLGDPGTPGVDIISVAYSFNLPVKFSDELEQAAAKIPSEFEKVNLDGRIDLRDLTCFTIDPIDARDYDDAVSLEKLDNGNWELGVHIADVSHFVEENSTVDKEALKRGTSVYLVDRVIPMLPERLSNELCSLKPETDRLTFSCFMEFDGKYDIVNYRITPSIINSNRRFTYEEVQDIIDGKIDDALSPVIKDMHTTSKALTKKRFEKGGIDFETPEVRFILDEKGQPTEIVSVKRLDSHRLVEEFMLAANQTVARHILKISPQKSSALPFIYRVHEKPDQDKMNKFFDFLTALEIPFKPVKSMTSRYFQQLLESIKGSKEETIIEEVALRSMMKAVYSVKNIGHFGLGFNDYTHFTSPIRRYPDLTVHRLLKKYNDTANKSHSNLNAKLKNICDQSTRMERLALEAERESIKLKQTEYINRYIGESFEGLVSGVMPFGVFVELKEIFVEGLIHISEMTDDFYIHDDKTYSWIGRDTDKVIRLGDEVRIKVEKVDLEKKSIDFILLENLTDEAGRHKVHIKAKSQRRRPKKKRRTREN